MGDVIDAVRTEMLSTISDSKAEHRRGDEGQHPRAAAVAHCLEAAPTVLSLTPIRVGDRPEARPSVGAQSRKDRTGRSRRSATGRGGRRVDLVARGLAGRGVALGPVLGHLIGVQHQDALAALDAFDREDLVDLPDLQRFGPAATSSASRSLPPVHEAEEAQVGAAGQGLGDRDLRPARKAIRSMKRSVSPGELMLLLTPTRSALEGEQALASPRDRGQRRRRTPRRSLSSSPGRPSGARRRSVGRAARAGVGEVNQPPEHRTSCGDASARKSRTTRRNSSASSICGEWPDFSNTTSRASGISEAIVSLHATGVIQSSRPDGDQRRAGDRRRARP